MNTVFDQLSVTEFEEAINHFIEREDPNSISLSALEEAARLQFMDAMTTRVELTGELHQGQIIFDPLHDLPIVVNGNEVVIGGLHIVIHLRPTMSLAS